MMQIFSSYGKQSGQRMDKTEAFMEKIRRQLCNV